MHLLPSVRIDWCISGRKSGKGTFYPEDQVFSDGRLTIGSTAGPHHHDITTVSGGGVGGQEGEGEGLW